MGKKFYVNAKGKVPKGYEAEFSAIEEIKKNIRDMKEKIAELKEEKVVKDRITSYNVCYTKLLRIVYSDGTKTNYELDKIQTNDDNVQVNSGVIDTFIEGILQNKKTTIDAEEAIESMKVVFACLDSDEKGCTVKL